MLQRRHCCLIIVIFIEFSRFHAVSCFVSASQWHRPYVERFRSRLKNPNGPSPRTIAKEGSPRKSALGRRERIKINSGINESSLLRRNSTETPEINEIVVHKVKETVSHTGVITTLHIIVERFVESMERFSEHTLERVTERTLQRSAERSWERVGERTLERVGERTWERSGERVLERVNERALERFSERMGERMWERVGERALERTGKRTLERGGERALNRFLERRFLGLSLGHLAVRLGRGLTIALPLFGGLFALYLFHGDILRWQDERLKLKACVDMNDSEHLGPQRYSWSATAALALLLGAGITDFLDAMLHFWMSYGLWVAHHPHCAHDWKETTIWVCAILSTIFAICGEIFSHQNSAARRNAIS